MPQSRRLHIQVHAEGLAQSRPQPIWWVLGGGFAFLLLGVGWIYFLDDVEPPDPALYEIEFRQKTDGENPLGIFAIETATLRESMRDDWNKHYQEEDQLSALSEHLEANRELLARFWKVVNDAPRPLDYPSDIEDYRTGCTFALQDGAALASRHIKFLTLKGRYDEALTEALALAEFSSGLCAAEVTAVPWLVAVTAQFMGFNGIRKALKGATLNEGDISNLLVRLRRVEVTAIDLSQTLRRSAFATSFWLRECKEKSRIGPGWMGEMNRLEMQIFKPNESAWEVLQLMLPVASALEGGWISGWRASEELQNKATAMGHPTSFWDQIRPNRSGRWFAANLQAGDQHTVRKALQSVAICRSLQLALALRAFDVKTGSLPESAQDLVPAYLPAVQVDPITGSPLKWNRQTGLIYSVGMNGVDDAGRFDLEQLKIGDKDWGILYPWWNKEEEKGDGGRLRR